MSHQCRLAYEVALEAMEREFRDSSLPGQSGTFSLAMFSSIVLALSRVIREGGVPPEHREDVLGRLDILLKNPRCTSAARKSIAVLIEELCN